MSGRTVSALTLTAALLLGALAPVAAQEGRPATMPAPTPPGPVVPVVDQIGATDAMRLYGVETKWSAPPVPAPAHGRVSAGQGVRITVPALGPVPLALDGGFPVTPPSDHRQVFNLAIGLFGERPAPPLVCPPGMSGGFGSYCAPALPRLQTTQPQAVARPGFVLIGAEEPLMAPPTCPPCPLPKIAPNPLVGTWYRELPGMGTVVAATFTHDELKLCLTQSADGHTVTATVTAHYAVTPDGLVFGAVTGGDVDVKSAPKAGESPFGMELAELSLTMQTLVDVPFSFRTKATSAGLMVSAVKCGSPLRLAEVEQLGGLFKSAKDGKVPAPAALKTATSRACVPPPPVCLGIEIGAPTCKLPPDWTFERVGVDFGTNPPTMNLPVQPCPVPPADNAPFGPPFLTKVPGLNPYSPQAVPPPAMCPAPPMAAPCTPPGLSQVPYMNQLFKNVGPAPAPPAVRPVQPGVSEDGTKQLAQDAFGQLLQQSGVLPPAAGMTLPSPRYLEHYPQYTPPEPVRPASATVPAPAAKGIPVGTWYRDVAGKQCVMKVAADHLTFTVHDAQEVDGKVSVASLVITADYHTTRDGMTAVGLITNVDVNFEGEFPPEDAKPFFEMLTGLQKELEDKPFALTFRLHGETLVLGSVRMPTGANYMDVQPAVYVAGRYKSAGDKLPKPKPTKMPLDPRANTLPPLGLPGTSNLPGSAYPDRTLLPPPALPGANSDLIPPQQVLPAPRAKVIPSGGTDSWAPPMAEPTKPVPQMPQPVPPPDDSARIKELLYESETTGPIGQTPRAPYANPWRRFWNNDRPSHLTPERIHGGIY